MIDEILRNRRQLPTTATAPLPRHKGRETGERSHRRKCTAVFLSCVHVFYPYLAHVPSKCAVFTIHPRVAIIVRERGANWHFVCPTRKSLNIAPKNPKCTSSVCVLRMCLVSRMYGRRRMGYKKARGLSSFSISSFSFPLSSLANHSP